MHHPKVQEVHHGPGTLTPTNSSTGEEAEAPDTSSPLLTWTHHIPTALVTTDLPVLIPPQALNSAIVVGGGEGVAIGATVTVAHPAHGQATIPAGTLPGGVTEETPLAQAPQIRMVAQGMDGTHTGAKTGPTGALRPPG